MTVVIRGEDAPTYQMGGSRIIGQAAPARGSRELATWRVHLDPGVATSAHTHDHEEVLHIISGSFRAKVDGDTLTLAQGDTLIIPAGALHQMFHAGEDEHAEGLAVMPAGAHFILSDGTDNGVPAWAQ